MKTTICQWLNTVSISQHTKRHLWESFKIATHFIWGEVYDIKHSLMDKLQQRIDEKSFGHKYDLSESTP